MKVGLITILCVLIGMCVNCKKSDDYIKHKSNGRLVTQTLKVLPFHSIVADAKSEIVLKQANKQKVEVTVSENIINDIDLTVVDSVWTIDFKEDNIATINRHDFKIVISAPDFRNICMENSGSLNTKGTLDVDFLNISQNSSGEMQIQMNVDSLIVDVDGSGGITLTGNATQFNLIHDSSGSVIASALQTDDCSIYQGGSGDTRVNVTRFLKCIIEGGGNIYYRGSPEVQKSGEGGGEPIQY